VVSNLPHLCFFILHTEVPVLTSLMICLFSTTAMLPTHTGISGDAGNHDSAATSTTSATTTVDNGSEPIGTVAVSLGSFSLRRPSWASPKGLRHKLQTVTAGGDVSPRRRSSGKSPICIGWHICYMYITIVNYFLNLY
jgi:hypothetical protein